MIISENSQLGLRFRKPEEKEKFLKLAITHLEGKLSTVRSDMEFFKSIVARGGKAAISEEEATALKLEWHEDNRIKIPDDRLMQHEARSKIVQRIDGHISSATGVPMTSSFMQSIIWECETSKYFLICDSVYHAASLIKIGDGFTGRILKGLHNGHHTYLMGKHRMVRFTVVPGAVGGFFYDDELNITFDFGVDTESGEFYESMGDSSWFSVVMQVMTFIELGDIEVIELPAGRNNGKTKAQGKITNTAKNTVYVVDSSWNKLIIRTEGFAVRGHFRLQACGHGLIDRKLIWIDAFEKHGYIRRPRAEIIRD